MKLAQVQLMLKSRMMQHAVFQRVTTAASYSVIKTKMHPAAGNSAQDAVSLSRRLCANQSNTLLRGNRCRSNRPLMTSSDGRGVSSKILSIVASAARGSFFLPKFAAQGALPATETHVSCKIWLHCWQCRIQHAYIKGCVPFSSCTWEDIPTWCVGLVARLHQPFPGLLGWLPHMRFFLSGPCKNSLSLL